jgi:phosphoribosyl 1,2-cyclic phosphate phosphodiesterase
MKITLLGTGTSQGVPVIGCNCSVCTSKDKKDKRLRSSVLIENEGTTVVIDTGPDFRYQMLRAGVKNLDAVLLTHEHYDHVAGLDDIRAFNRIRKTPVDVYAEPRVIKEIEHTMRYAFAANKYPGVPSINNIALTPGKEISVGSLNIMPVRLMHHKLPVLGFRTGDFAYLTDVSFVPDETMKILKGLKVLVIDGLRHVPHISHFSIQEALEVIAVIKPGQGIITHMSHQIGCIKMLQAPFRTEWNWVLIR